jgi:hypothetical protein
MKTGTVVLLAVAGLFAYHILGLGVAGGVAQLVFQGITANGPLNFTLNFIVQNVSNTTINFNSMAGTVTINGNNVGNVSSFPAVPVPIPGNSQQPVNVNLDLSVLGLVGEIATLLQTPGTTLNFEVKGNLNANAVIIPFDVTQQISI